MKKALFTVTVSISLLSANVAFAQGVAVGPSNPEATGYTPTVVSNTGACASLTSTGLKGVASCIISILDDITVIIIAASVVYIIYGAFTMIRSEEKRESGRQTVVYGIIGLFAMISIWGFVNILNSTFHLSKGYGEVVGAPVSNLFPGN